MMSIWSSAMDLPLDWLMSGAAIVADRSARPFQGNRGAFVNMTWGSATFVQRRANPPKQILDLLLIDNERRRESNPVSDQAEDHALFADLCVDLVGDLLFGRERGPALLVLHDLDAADQADAFGTADQRMIAQAVQAGQERLLHPLH